MSHLHGSSEPSCREICDLLSDYVDGELVPEARALLVSHLEGCPPCERFLKTFQKTRSLCRESLLQEMPEELRARLHAFLQERITRK